MFCWSILKGSYLKYLKLLQLTSDKIICLRNCNLISNRRLTDLHSVKSVCIRSFSGPYFPAVGLNRERYGVSLRIQPESGKIQSRTTRNTDSFHADLPQTLALGTWKVRVNNFSHDWGYSCLHFVRVFKRKRKQEE